MPINVNDQDYVQAEKDYYDADSVEEKIEQLKIMISHAPGHKGAENLRAQLKTRLKKLKEQLTKSKKSGKSNFQGIKKHDMQAVMIGFTNSGKSSLLSLLTNAQVKISENKFTTKKPIVGMMSYAGTSIQIIENPSIKSNSYDKGLTNTADTILIIINELEQIPKIKKHLEKSKAKKIIVFNDQQNLSENEKRKVKATLKSKKYNYVLLNISTKENLEKLKEKIFQSFDNIRIFTKEPGKEKSPNPIIMKPNATVKKVAEKILHGFADKVKTIKIWGPSSKFAGQTVGLKHKLKDLDTVEFRTR